jgi:hypothetical protein
MQIRLSDLARLTAREQAEVLREMVADARTNGRHRRAIINSRIRGFEERYEISSDEMLRRLATGEMSETADVSMWLYLLDASRSGAPQ